LYKKAGFKTAEGFQEQFVWEVSLDEEKYTIQLFAKKTGRLQKNAYNFPPPIEESVFYGNCLLVCTERNLTAKLWDSLFESIYEKYDNDELDDDEDTEELLDDQDSVVAEDDISEEEEVDEADEEGPILQNETKRSKKTSQKKDSLLLFGSTNAATTEEQFLDCSCELELEPYLT
jgi:hypothetical protein